jgi:cold shock CspA family protein
LTHIKPGSARRAYDIFRSELHPDEAYGRIETPDGRLIYFHRNSVVGADFDALRIGAEVRFHAEAGERGPQASTVHVIGKHHIAG